MDPALLGGIAELIAAAAVVVSLLYLARQVSESTKQARLSSMQALYAQQWSVLALTAANGNTARIWLDGLEHGPESLDRYDALQFGQLCLHALKAFEEVYHYRNEGVIDEVWFVRIERALMPVVSFKGFKEWWQATNMLFAPDFRTYLEGRAASLEPELDFQGYPERLGFAEPRGSPPTRDLV